MRYFCIILAILSLVSSIFLVFMGKFTASEVSFLTSILAFGIDDILDELRNNGEVIVRDPKTGRFTKK